MKSSVLIWFILGVFLLPKALYGQKNIQDSTITVPYLSLGYIGSSPGGDLDERFGYTGQLFVEAGLKHKSNFYITGGVEFVFGNRINEPIASAVTSLNGSEATGFAIQAIGTDGRWYNIRLFQRGWMVPVRVGKLFPIIKKHNNNSGLFVEAGAQFIQHKVKIDVIGGSVAQLSNELIPGYDRLTNGFGITEGIGYRYFSDRRLINFQIGFQFSQNFTASRRDFNFDYGFKDTRNRMDLLSGFRVGWVFPIYESVDTRAYY